jgi:hypothetical protein
LPISSADPWVYPRPSRMTRSQGRGRQEFMGAVQYSRSGCPDMDVRTSRFEPLSYVLGPLAFESSFVGFKDLLDRLKAS